MKKAEKQFLQNYYKVKAKLEEHNMMFKQVKKYVGLTKPKILYYVDKELKLSGKETSRKKHERHLFSVVDLFGLALVDELRALSIQTEICREVFKIFRKYLTEKLSAAGPSLIQALSSSKPMELWLDSKALQLGIVFIFPIKGSVLQNQLERLNKPRIIVPLTPIYQTVVTKIKRDDLQMKLVNDKPGKGLKVIYCVDGENIDIVHDCAWHDGYVLYLDESKVKERLEKLLSDKEYSSE